MKDVSQRTFDASIKKIRNSYRSGRPQDRPCLQSIFGRKNEPNQIALLDNGAVEPVIRHGRGVLPESAGIGLREIGDGGPGSAVR